MSEDLPFVSVIVPSRNGGAMLRECLTSILHADYPRERLEVIVVDNASTDETHGVVSGLPPVRWLCEYRLGPSSARNRGIVESRGEILAFTDADCVVSRQWIRDLVAGFEDEDIDGVAGEVLPFPPRTPAEVYSARRNSHWQRAALESGRPFAVTCNVAYRRETFDRIGLFDPELLKAQDKDFGWRFFAADLKLEYRSAAIVFHRHRRTTYGLFRQHAGWGYGAALLHAKHGLPWSARQELVKYAELDAAIGRVASAALRHAVRRDAKPELCEAWFDFVRRAGLRAGALRALVDVGRRRRLVISEDGTDGRAGAARPATAHRHGSKLADAEDAA